MQKISKMGSSRTLAARRTDDGNADKADHLTRSGTGRLIEPLGTPELKQPTQEKVGAK